MSQRIGGRLDANALALLARPETAHRPDDVETLRREVLRLASEGLTPLDIGQALRLHPAEVAGLLDLSTGGATSDRPTNA